jgi:hypothetical protein
MVATMGQLNQTEPHIGRVRALGTLSCDHGADVSLLHIEHRCCTTKTHHEIGLHWYYRHVIEHSWEYGPI